MRKLLLLLIIGNVLHAQVARGPAGPKLQVVIVSVSSFDDNTHYASPVLQKGIADSSKELKEFFTSHFPNAVVTIKEKPEETTSDALSKFFRNDFQEIVNGNVTVLFVLSHGEYVPFPNSKYGNDLYIVTKDTDGSSTSSIKRSALSLTTDLLPKVSGLKDGSILLAFIDTCHAGAARSVGIDLQTINADLAGMKMMIMGASMSDRLAFQASFSDALVKLWQRSNPTGSICTSPEQSPRLIHDQIKTSLAAKGVDLAVDDGFPSVLIHYHGSLCLENLSAARSLVLVQNTTSDALVVRFTDRSGGMPPYDEPIDQYDNSLISLPRGPYTIEFYVANEQKEHFDIDLSQNWHYENYGTPAPGELAQAFVSASNRAEAAGFSEDTVTSFRKRAYAAFVAGNDQANAAKMAVLLRPSELPQAQEVPSVSATYDALVEDAQKTLLTGDFHAGAERYVAAAKLAAPASPASTTAAIQAYFAAAAAGDAKTATTIRKDFTLPESSLCDSCISLEKSANSSKNKTAVTEFKKQGLMNSLQF